MKNLFLILLFPFVSFAQQEPVTWTDSISWENDSTVIIHLIADIQEGWHIYGTDLGDQIGPVPTTIMFNQNEELSPIGELISPAPINHFDEAFGMDLSYYEHYVVFSQKFIFKSETELSYSIDFMVCDNSTCLPPTLIEKNIIFRSL